MILEKEIPCKICQGTGKVWDECHHTGRNIAGTDEPCKTCEGTGRVMVPTTTEERLDQVIMFLEGRQGDDDECTRRTDDADSTAR